MGLLAQALAYGSPVVRLYGETHAGRAVMDMRYRDLDRRLCGLGMQRGALFALLEQAWGGRADLHADTRIVAIDQVRRRLRDERGHGHGRYDLIVAADGSASELRQEVQGTRLDREYPWGALWCLLSRGDWTFGDELRQRYLGARKMIGRLPVGTCRWEPGRTIRCRDSVSSGACRATTSRFGKRGITAWLDEIAALWPSARVRLQAVTQLTQLARASYRDAVMTRWYRGRVVVAGDAAHAMSSQLGQGGNMALMDAWALCEALRGERGVETVLPAYQRQRGAHVAIYQFWSRWLTPMFQSEHDGLARARDLAFMPLARLPVGRGPMLRVLSGTQQGWFGKLALDEGFPETLTACTTNP